MGTALIAQNTSIDVPDLTTIIKSDSQEQRIFIDSNEIEEFKPANTVELLQSMGITLKGYGGYGTLNGISVRGFRNKNIIVTVDGITVADPQFGTFNLHTIPIENIESIEIIKGSFVSDAGIEGGAGGVVNIVTKKQTTTTSAYIDISGLTYFNEPIDRGQLKLGTSIGLGSTSISFDANATYANNAFEYKDGSGVTKTMEHSRVGDAGFSAQLLHYFDNGSELLIKDRLFYTDMEIFGYASAPPSWFQNKDLQQDIHNSLLLSYTMPQIHSFDFKTSAQYDVNNREAGIPLGSDTYNIQTLQANAVANYEYNSHFSQSVGINTTVDILDSSAIKENLFLSGFLKSTSTVQLFDDFSIIVPLAIVFDDGSFEFIPRLGLQFDFEKGIIALNAYRLHAFPTLNEKYFDWNANKDLEAETGWGGEITLNMHGLDIPFSTSVFANYYMQKIESVAVDPINFIYKATNVGKSFYTGFDIILDKQITESFSLFANYQFVMSWSLYDIQSEKPLQFSDNVRMMYTPINTVAIGGTYTWNRAQLTITGNYVDERLDYYENTILPPYLFLDLVVSYDVLDNISTYLKVANILNADYEETLYYPTPGISATLGIRITMGS